MKRTGQPRDPTDGPPPFRQPLLHIDAAPTPLRACLLSGGASRRMGTDKALLPHPEGGSWLERTLRLLLELGIPVTLLSRHEQHLRLARAMGPSPVIRRRRPLAARSTDDGRGGDAVGNRPKQNTAAESDAVEPVVLTVTEPEPWEGPLLALHRLMELHPDQRLLLCAVDMPGISLEALQQLLQSSDAQPHHIHLAHDGERLQPLLGIYPSSAPLRADLQAAILRGERRMQRWLCPQPWRANQLNREAVRNLNSPQELKHWLSRQQSISDQPDQSTQKTND